MAGQPTDLDRRLLVAEIRQEELGRATLDALARIEARFEKIDARFDKIEARLTRVEEGLTEVKTGLAKLEGKVDAKPSAVAVVGNVAVVNGAALGLAGLLRFIG